MTRSEKIDKILDLIGSPPGDCQFVPRHAEKNANAELDHKLERLQASAGRLADWRRDGRPVETDIQDRD